jgi:hypothetical protein
MGDDPDLLAGPYGQLHQEPLELAPQEKDPNPVPETQIHEAGIHVNCKTARGDIQGRIRTLETLNRKGQKPL